MTDTGSEVIKTTLEDLIPAEIHGFAVRAFIGPYPPDQPRSHRKAAYAELLPLGDNVAKLHRAGRQHILGIAPLTREAATAIEKDLGGMIAELAARRALTEASKIAKLVNQA